MTDQKPIIHVVDDDASFRSAISELLIASNYRVSQYDSATQLLKAPPVDEIGCILLDLQMAGLNGMQLQERLVAFNIRLPIVFLSGHGDISTSVQAIKAGAEDFLTKPVAKDKLLAAIARALSRYETLHKQHDRTDGLRKVLSSLTPREYEVFELLTQDISNKEIARMLGITVRTAKFHRRNILEKCEATSVSQLALIAERLHLFSAR
jgi:FixJ family two-component response regulator